MAAQDLKERTAKGLIWGLANNGSMQVLNLVFGIVLGRLLCEADYGLAGEVAVFTAIASALQESGFISALINRKNATAEDFNSVFWFNVTVSASIYGVLFLTAPLLVWYFGEPELLWLSRYAFLAFFFASFSIAPRAHFYKNLMMKEQTLIGIVALLVSGAVGITMAVMKCGAWSLVTQNILFILTVSVLSWKISGFRPMLRFAWQPIREMFGFSCKLLITNIFNTVNNSIFALLLGNFYTKNEVGRYQQADKWNKMGSGLVTGMVQSVAQPMFVQVENDAERLRRAFRKMLRLTSLLCFPAMLGLALVAREFITITVGPKWLPSAELMQMLCVAGAFMPLAALYYNFLISRGRSNVYMWNIVCQGVLTLGLLCAVHFLGLKVQFSLFHWQIDYSSIRLMVLLYVVVYVGWMLVWHWFVWREVGLRLTDALRDTLPFLAIAVVSMGLTAWLTQGTGNAYVLLAVRIAVAGVLYLGLTWLTGARILRESINFIRQHGKQQTT